MTNSKEIRNAVFIFLISFLSFNSMTFTQSQVWSTGLEEHDITSRPHGTGVAHKSSEEIVTEIRNVKDFDEIKLGGSARVTVHVGEPYSLTLVGDKEDLENLVTEVSGSTLTIEPKKECTTTHFNSGRTTICTSIDNLGPIHVMITVPALRDVTMSGSDKVTAHNLRQRNFDIKVTGSGSLTANGVVQILNVRISGSGGVDTSGLSADDVSVKISGSGGAIVAANDALGVRISGSGSLLYHGNPKISKHITGSGTIRRIP